MEDRALDIARDGAEAGEEKKANGVLILDLRGTSILCDYAVLMSGGTRVQTRAISTAIEERLKKSHGRLGSRQGYRGGNWILLDFQDVVFHVFLDQERRYYDLEDLWKNAPVVYQSAE